MGELPVFTCQAHVFAINPTTKKSWLPSSSKAVDVNVFYDHTKHCHRIISVEDTPNGKKVIINSTLTEKMAFKKTSQKFGQWADTKTGGVHGLGFSSEAELTEFANHFKQYVEASKSPPAMSALSSVTINGVSSCLTDVLPSLPGCTSQTLLPQTLSQLTSNQLTLNSGSTLCYASPPPAASLFASKSFSTTLAQTLSAISPKPAPGNVVPPDLTSSSQLQVQLAQAQAQVRRLEAELSATKHEVANAEHSTSDLGQPASNGSHLQDYRSKLEPLTNGVAPTPMAAGVVTGPARTEVEKWVNDNFSGSPRPPSSATPTTSPGLMTLVDKQFLLTGGGGGPSRGEVEKTSLEWLHHRLGVILHEAVDLHTRLGVLLAISPSRQPSVYRSPPSG